MALRIKTWDETGGVQIVAQVDWGIRPAARGPGFAFTTTSATSTTIKFATGAVATDKLYDGYRIVLTGGTGAGQQRTISSYVGSTLTATVDSPWSITPDATTTGRVFFVEKFFAENDSTRTLEDLVARLSGPTPDLSRFRFAADTATVVPPWNFAAALGPTADGGVWSSTGAKYYRITALNATGETQGSREIAITVDDTTKRVTLTWTKPTGATGYKVYRTTAQGVYTTPALVATVGDVATYVDNGSGPGSGGLPAANTTGGGAPFYGSAPTLGIDPITIGDLQVGQMWVYWAGPEEIPAVVSDDVSRRTSVVLEEVP
jgi:hypothetical protein